jgi:uncharacterized membrane protein YadS
MLYGVDLVIDCILNFGPNMVILIAYVFYSLLVGYLFLYTHVDHAQTNSLCQLG